MTDMPKKEETKGNPPGVCIPWEQKVKEFGQFVGNPEGVKKEWEKLDAFAYMYLWYWVHR